MSYIKTWVERCDEHPDHQSGMVSNGMIQARMQEEIDDLREALAIQQGCCDGAAAQDAHVRQEREEHESEVEKLRAENERLRAAATSAGAALAAAIELLERGREDAPSKRMFSQMLADYRVIVARTRKALEGEP